MRALLRLAAIEMKLFVREPMVLIFVFAFPVLTVLILGGVFDDDDPAFEGALPSDYYIAAYIGVVIAAIGLVMLPVHLASYRERGVLRRFDVSHYPRWALPAAWILVATGHHRRRRRRLARHRPPRVRPPRSEQPSRCRCRDAARSVRLHQYRHRARPGAPQRTLGTGAGDAALLPLLPARRCRPTA